MCHFCPTATLLPAMRLFNLLRQQSEPSLKCVPDSFPPQRHHLAQLEEFLHQSRKLLVLTGAGLSTESGIPDYRFIQNVNFVFNFILASIWFSACKIMQLQETITVFFITLFASILIVKFISQNCKFFFYNYHAEMCYVSQLWSMHPYCYLLLEMVIIFLRYNLYEENYISCLTCQNNGSTCIL